MRDDEDGRGSEVRALPGEVPAGLRKTVDWLRNHGFTPAYVIAATKWYPPTIGMVVDQRRLISEASRLRRLIYELGAGGESICLAYQPVRVAAWADPATQTAGLGLYWFDDTVMAIAAHTLTGEAARAAHLQADRNFAVQGLRPMTFRRWFSFGRRILLGVKR